MDIEDWKVAIHDTLVDTYAKIRGETPEGSFIPDDELVRKILEKFSGMPEASITKFCRNSMFAHMLKTQKTRTPFFIKNILSKASLAYLEKHASYLKEFYLQNVEPLQFFNAVYGEVLNAELDYLDVVGGLWIKGKHKLAWDIIQPSVHWIIFSQSLGRIDHKALTVWDDVVVEYDGAFVPMVKARGVERGMLGDSMRYNEAMTAARQAIYDATVTWAAGLGFINTRVDENKEVVILPSSEMPVALLGVKTPLEARDRELFDWAASKVAERALDPLARKHEASTHMIQQPMVEPMAPTQVEKINPSIASAIFAATEDA